VTSVRVMTSPTGVAAGSSLRANTRINTSRSVKMPTGRCASRTSSAPMWNSFIRSTALNTVASALTVRTSLPLCARIARMATSMANLLGDVPRVFHCQVKFPTMKIGQAATLGAQQVHSRS
jgi:hypothetical protein